MNATEAKLRLLTIVKTAESSLSVLVGHALLSELRV